MASLDTLITVPAEPREPDLTRIRQLLAERRRYQLPPGRSLAGLRRSRSVSQETLAGRLGLKQARLSKFERHPDPRLSALRAYVASLGGALILLASFPDRNVHLELLVPGPD